MTTPRRSILKAIATAPALAAAGPAMAAEGPHRRVKRVATEEGFSIPELNQATNAYLAAGAADEPAWAAMRKSGYNPRTAPEWPLQLIDLGERRIKDMDAAGIDMALLMVGSPGVQIFGPEQGGELAALCNDRLAAAVRAHPTRFAGLAALAPQAPDKAAQELERAVTTLGLKGAIINSHTKAHYLDEKAYWPILEAAQALDVPIYIHPREPSPGMIAPYLSPAMLAGAAWGFAGETGLHGVRLIMEGVFDQFPRLKIVLGHGGEAIPFFMDRLDVRYREEGVPARAKLKKKPSDYVRENIYVTSSGLNWAPAIRFCQEVMGADRVMFAADYPFEDAVEAVRAAEAAPMTAADHTAFFHKTAETVFKL